MLKRATRSIVFCFFAALLSVQPCEAQHSISHKVESGETLFTIAENYNVTVAQIKAWNNLTSNTLSIGQRLVINEQSGTGSATVHVVQPKESLNSISKKYGVSIAQLKEWNDLQGQNLSIGARLNIYPEQTGQSKRTSGGGGSSSSYTVKSGDSLFRIARMYNMTVERLKELNNLTSNNIQVGQRLAVQPTNQPPSLTAAGVETSGQGNFVRYTVSKSQSRAELLKKFEMDEEEFFALNPGLDRTSFRRGDKVNLLAPANQSFKNPYVVNSALSRLGTAQAVPYENNAATTTTSGELYNPAGLTAAHPNMAMGSVIFVQNDENKRGVLVRINDRTTENVLKLSQAAWETLGLRGNNDRVTLFRSDE